MKKSHTLQALIMPFIKPSCFIFFLFCIGHVSIAQTGVLDVIFGNKGKVFTQVSIGKGFRGFAIQPDGKLIAVRGSWNGSSLVPTVIRYTAFGRVSSLFATEGIVSPTIKKSG